MYEWYDFSLKETGVRLDYIFLLTMMFFIFIVNSRSIARSVHNENMRYWKIAAIPIIAFSFIEGLRYARGVDYIVYLYKYIYALDPAFDDEPLFLFFNGVLNLTGLPYWGAFIVYSFLWIVSIFYFCQPFKYMAYLCIPFALIASIPSMENLVRQFVSLSFVLISLSCLLGRKYEQSVFWAIISFGFHLSSVVVICLIYIVYVFKHNKCFNIYGVLLLYGFFFFFFELHYIDPFINNILSILNLGDLRFTRYLEQADRWFTSSAGSESYERSIWGNLALFLFDTVLFIMGNKSIYKEKDLILRNKLIIIYNLFIVGAVGMQAVMSLEIVRRFFRPLYMLWFIIASNALYQYPIKRKMQLNKMVFMSAFLWGYIILVLLCKSILLFPSQMFVWDSFKYRL